MPRTGHNVRHRVPGMPLRPFADSPANEREGVIRCASSHEGGCLRTACCWSCWRRLPSQERHPATTGATTRARRTRTSSSWEPAAVSVDPGRDLVPRRRRAADRGRRIPRRQSARQDHRAERRRWDAELGASARRDPPLRRRGRRHEGRRQRDGLPLRRRQRRARRLRHRDHDADQSEWCGGPASLRHQPRRLLLRPQGTHRRRSTSWSRRRRRRRGRRSTPGTSRSRSTRASST